MQGVLHRDRPPYFLPALSLVDTVVYFAHCVVSPPPGNWIRAGHRCRTAVLVPPSPLFFFSRCLHAVFALRDKAHVQGTLIFEWEAGARELRQLLECPERCVQQLVSMARSCGFDGWLVNVGL